MDVTKEMPVSTSEYQQVLDNLKWTHALLSILVEQEGGVVEIRQEVVEDYDLSGRVQVEFDPESLVYRVQVIPADVDSEATE